MGSEPELVIEPFFVEDHNDEYQAEYERRARNRRSALIETYPSYNTAIHDQILLSMIRSEIMAELYERRIASQHLGEEMKTARVGLATERANIEKCGKKLMTDLKSVKSEGASDVPDGDIMSLGAQVKFDDETEEAEVEEAAEE